MTQMLENNLAGLQHFPRRRQRAIQNFDFFLLQSIFPVRVIKKWGGTTNTSILNLGTKWK